MSIYRCPACQTKSTIASDDDIPVCNKTDDCGLLFEEDIVRPEVAKATAPHRPTFRLFGSGYEPGDERSYTVHSRGYEIGSVEPCPLPGRETDSVVDGWAFTSTDRLNHGSGRTRAEAVANAY